MPYFCNQTAALPTILKKEHLIKGNSVFSFAYQGVDLAFNALAGILVALISTTAFFLIDSLTFVVAALLFSTLQLPKKELKYRLEQHSSFSKSMRIYGKELKEGFYFVTNSILAKFFVGWILLYFRMKGCLS